MTEGSAKRIHVHSIKERIKIEDANLFGKIDKERRRLAISAKANFINLIPRNGLQEFVLIHKNSIPVNA